MSITRERLNEISASVAVQVAVEIWPLEDHFESELTETDREYYGKFAHALLKAVEAECEVVGYRHATAKGCYANEAWVYGADAKPLIALPLVKGEL